MKCGKINKPHKGNIPSTGVNLDCGVSLFSMSKATTVDGGIFNIVLHHILYYIHVLPSYCCPLTIGPYGHSWCALACLQSEHKIAAIYGCHAFKASPLMGDLDRY